MGKWWRYIKTIFCSSLASFLLSFFFFKRVMRRKERSKQTKKKSLLLTQDVFCVSFFRIRKLYVAIKIMVHLLLRKRIIMITILLLVLDFNLANGRRCGKVAFLGA